MHLAGINATAQEAVIAELRAESRSLTSKLAAIESSYKELALDKRVEIDGLERDLEQYKSKFHKSQSEIVRLTRENDSMREERLQLLRNLKEAKQDCDAMAQLLEDKQEAGLERREELLHKEEIKLKEAQEHCRLEQERLALLIA